MILWPQTKEKLSTYKLKKKICFHFSLQSTRNADKNASLDACVYIRNDAKQQYCQSSRRFLWIYVNDYTKTSNLQLPCSLLQTAFSFLCKPYVVIQQRKEVVEKNGLWVTLNFYLHLAKARRFLFFSPRHHSVFDITMQRFMVVFFVLREKLNV